MLFLAEGRLRTGEPLYAEQPRYILLDRRDDPDESTDASEPLTNPQDLFWVARGRRQHKPVPASAREDSFWASMQGLHELLSPDNHFRLHGLGEGPLWSTRARSSSFKHLDDSRSRSRDGLPNYVSVNGLRWSPRGRRSTDDEFGERRGFLETLSAEEPFWAARGKKCTVEAVDGNDDGPKLVEAVSADVPVWAGHMKASGADRAPDSRSKPGPLGMASVEEPYWAATARRNDEESEEKRDPRSSLLESLSAEEPFWAARGRRHFLATLPAEEPFWAARGKKESSLMTSPSPDDLLSQVSSLHTRSN
jgi:uncharacterized membrane protein